MFVMCMLTRGQPSYNSTCNPKSQYLYNKFPKDMRKRVDDPARAYEQWQKLGVKCLDSPSLVFEASSFEPLDSFIRTLDKANSGN